MYNDFFIPENISLDLNLSGSISQESPSNIALIKYWGKKATQIPTNPSISFTLKKCKTITTLDFSPKKTEVQQLKIFLDNQEKKEFIPKIQSFIERIGTYSPWIKSFDYTIKTHNTFPHSSGIASSASGMSALAKCFIHIEKKVTKSVPNEHKCSFLARLGSGSACRSVYKGLVAWGDSEYVNKSSNLYAIPIQEKIAPVFKTFKDCILLIHEGTKSVSSTIGHNLMNNHPYANTRFSEAKKNLGKMIRILAKGDIKAFGELVEHEALSLHAVMLTSNPAFILMQPSTISAINKIWEFRKETDLPLYFTLDAGANIHLLYPNEKSNPIEAFIKEELLIFCSHGKAIFDDVSF